MKKTFTIIAMLTVCLTTLAQQTEKDELPWYVFNYQKVAIRLFNEVLKGQTGNVCFSPFSAQIALSMLQNGAIGDTQELMKQVLLTNGSQEQLNDYNRSTIRDLTYRPQFTYYENSWMSKEEQQKTFDALWPICEIANSIWYRPDVELCEPFEQAMREYYDAGTAPVAFDTQEGIDIVNGWVNEKTHGLIPSIYNEPQSDDLAIVLINALYLKAAWAVPFWKELTKKEPFHLEDGTKIQTDMMYVSDPAFTTAQTDAFRCVNIPYNNHFCMTVFIPAEGYELPAITYEDWTAAIQATENRYSNDVGVKLKMPKFTIEGGCNLIPVLKAMGMGGILEGEGGDFTGMCLQNKAISKIFQLDKIIVDEEGTEAAAVTVIEATDSEPEEPKKVIDFFIDRPFYFTIENLKTHTILFMGKVMNPGGEVTHQPTGIQVATPHQPDAPVYDLSGRRLQHIPAHGIYIQDGKKYVRP